jgi:hypothetical protein
LDFWPKSRVIHQLQRTGQINGREEQTKNLQYPTDGCTSPGKKVPLSPKPHDIEKEMKRLLNNLTEDGLGTEQKPLDLIQRHRHFSILPNLYLIYTRVTNIFQGALHSPGREDKEIEEQF